MPPFLVRTIWLASAAVTLLLLSQPLGTDVQLEMSLGAIAVMVLLWLFAKGRTGRLTFLAIGSLVVLRYIYWRLSSTLPPVSDLPGFTAGVILIAAELYCFYILAVSLVINADPLRRPPPPQDADDDLPTVDIFVPSYNEDRHILATTLAAAKSIDYPAHKFTVWLLDDGGRTRNARTAIPARPRRRVRAARSCRPSARISGCPT